MGEENTKRPEWEPPPWEAEAFEALKRRREEREADAEIAQAVSGLGAPEEPVPLVPPATVEPEPVDAAEAGVESLGTTPAAQDDPRVEAMLMGLKAEEPAVGGRMWMVGAVTAVFMIAGGLVLIVLGGAAALRAGRTTPGLVGSLILLIFGGVFVGFGVWLVQRTLKIKGVI